MPLGMRRLPLALAIGAIALISTGPAAVGHDQYGYHNQNYAQPVPKRQQKGQYRQDRRQEQRAQQIRRECRMFAFQYWRYHPQYKHCRYY